ncbi:DUF6790 family protein [Solidesulfovibrio alcoholivorans]|uniref:DUF6790 family protein n=1 Tax=Solidesulfovibrio alcoholivorans TaxID=81406 RepID=UPI000694B6AB|nr:DUF6790 family protein [Solidesulfovibrio alcoholivorans]
MERPIAFLLALVALCAASALPDAGSGILLVAGPLFGLAAAARKKARNAALLEDVLRYLVFFFVGVGGVWGGIGHVFFADKIAASIGWAPSPFQFEVGMANFGFGIAGLLAPFTRPRSWLGLITAQSVFLLGAAGGHIASMRAGNFAPNNAGVIFYTDILGPLAMLALYGVWRRADTRRHA